MKTEILNTSLVARRSSLENEGDESRVTSHKRHISHFVPQILMVAFCFLIPSMAGARATSFDVLNFRPVIDASKFYTTYESASLKHLDYNTAFYIDYAYKPLTRGGGAAGTRQGIVDNILTGHLGGAIGLWDFLEAGITFPVAFYEEFYDPAIANPPEQKKASLGDMGLILKLSLVETRDFPVGLAIIPFLNLPTGTGDIFTGSNSVSGGAKFTVDGKIIDRIFWAANMGFVARDKMTLRNVIVDDQFLLSGGVNVRIVDWLDAIGEIDTKTVFSNFFSDKTQSPVELRAGLRFYPAELGDFTVDFGVGGGVVGGLGAPDVRIFTGLIYSPGHQGERSMRRRWANQ